MHIGTTPAGLVLPDHLARTPQLDPAQWELLSFSLGSSLLVQFDYLELEAILRPVESDAISQCTALTGQCFFFQGHLFRIGATTVDVNHGGDIRVAISACSIWQQPSECDPRSPMVLPSVP